MKLLFIVVFETKMYSPNHLLGEFIGDNRVLELKDSEHQLDPASCPPWKVLYEVTFTWNTQSKLTRYVPDCWA
jgi:hypothetical protein